MACRAAGLSLGVTYDVRNSRAAAARAVGTGAIAPPTFGLFPVGGGDPNLYSSHALGKTEDGADFNYVDEVAGFLQRCQC